jgi:hypothetical protein
MRLLSEMSFLQLLVVKRSKAENTTAAFKHIAAALKMRLLSIYGQDLYDLQGKILY